MDFSKPGGIEYNDVCKSEKEIDKPRGSCEIMYNKGPVDKVARRSFLW